MNGILVINKPQGWTSHDVVNKARGVLREKKIGHAGTLDPLATGVLVLCVGRATRIVRYLEADDKEYRAELKLGETTDTQDAEGRLLGTRDYVSPSKDVVQRTLESFRGKILQRPPAYSAVKVSGVPSYRLARQGTIREHDERPVTIHAIGLIEYADPFVRFSVACSKGTYIRTLSADIGERLGMGAHLTALVRTRSGRFRLEQAISIEQLAEMASTGKAKQSLISLNEALAGLSAVIVTDDEARQIAHGSAIPVQAPPASEARGSSSVRILSHDGQLLAVARAGGLVLRPEVVLA